MILDNGLTEKQEMFCRHYVATNNGKISAEKAGYSKGSSSVQASRMMTEPKIQKRISELRSETIASLNKDSEQIVQWLYDIATPANGEPTGNRMKALELLGKYHGIFVEKKQIESHNTHNVYDYSNLSEDEIQKAIDALGQED